MSITYGDGISINSDNVTALVNSDGLTVSDTNAGGGYGCIE